GGRGTIVAVYTGACCRSVSKCKWIAPRSLASTITGPSHRLDGSELDARPLPRRRREDMIHLLGIGAQKAGTTWIYERMSLHPQIRFPAGKEIHFWDCYRSNGVDWWTGLFAEDDQRRKQGEITPAYSTLDEATIREIATFLPNLRVFYSLRNPIARAWSSALMALERAEMTIDEASHLWFLDHFKSAGATPWRLPVLHKEMAERFFP